jgi:predicted nucleic acid-binding protein
VKKYLADTNILCKQDTHPKIRNWVVQHFLSIGISAISIAEIQQGLEAMPAGKRRRELEAILQEIMEDYFVYPFGTAEALEWGRYVNEVNRPVPALDSLIAATARANDLEVVTENTRDFPGVATIRP